MKSRLLTIFLLVLAAAQGRAQLTNFADAPIEINAEGETKFEGGVAKAENNVVIQYGAATIYSDYAEYNPETRDVLVRGNVRIYREGFVFVGERAVYNLETKQIRAADFRGGLYPFQFSADSMTTLTANAFQVRDASLTTSDSSKPDYHLKAKSARIYTKDHMVLGNVTLYLGDTPVFWWPYLYQSLNKDQGFRFTPGYYSNWGAFLLTEYTFPIGDTLHGVLHFDPYSKRGVGLGFDTKFFFGADNKSWGKFRSYYIDDVEANSNNNTDLARVPITNQRYRLSFQSRVYLTEDIYTSIDLNKLSDPYIVQDFMPNEYQLDPQPDNVFSITKWNENYTITGVARGQLNTFFETTERLPEFTLDLKSQPLFNTPFFYEGETGVARLRRNYPNESLLSDYSTTRFDSLHQFLYPRVYGGWLSFTPRVGVRGTYYNNTLNDLGQVAGPTFRAAAIAGFDASFKFSKEFEGVESRSWGLEGLRHVIQPYTDFSYVYSNKNPENILQFDRFSQSTQLPSFDFPDFTSTDAIGTWSVWQFGFRNRLQTKRDGETINWMELDTFINLNIDEPHLVGTTYQYGRFSNLCNKFRWVPLPWLTFTVDSQIPVTSGGFTEVNTGVSFMVTQNVRFDLGHRYINGNPVFPNSSLITFGGYYRLNENWGVGISEQYETTSNSLEWQRYEVFRDLSSWVASLGIVVGNSNGVTQYGLVVSFTLKDAPQVNLPFGFNPQIGR